MNIDEDKILVLSYTSSNNQLKLLHVIFVDLLILNLRDFAVHSYLKKEKNYNLSSAHQHLMERN